MNIAKKAGYIVLGGDTLEHYTKKLYLILYDPESGKSTLKILATLQSKGLEALPLEQLSKFMHMETCRMIGIRNKSFSDQIKQILSEN